MKASLTSSIDTGRLVIITKSLNETTGVGTRMLMPPKMPCRVGMARPAAMLAPVVVGTMFSAALRASRRSLAGASCSFCEAV